MIEWPVVVGFLVGVLIGGLLGRFENHIRCEIDEWQWWREETESKEDHLRRVARSLGKK